MTLPPLPERGLLADLCREVGARESVQPYLVEKDFYLTRLLWTLGQQFGDQLLLKGGTLLSKVDLGFFRMSEDADLVIPEEGGHRGWNMRRTNPIRDALRKSGSSIGVTLEQSLRRELPAVLRVSAPPFDLARMLHRFERLW